ncbi:MAG: hypothetical protein PVI44_14855 [Balneolaceae bacterium]|jgi:uncharacterized protein (TIGR00290 family)
MDILFWSGGKDAYLALQFYREEHPESTIKLLTTFDEPDQVVPHQCIKMEEIKKQAASLGLELISVPLPPACPNELYLKRIKNALAKTGKAIDHLIFGDWHLEDIRSWREKVFGEMGFECVFPIWRKDIQELLPALLFNPITVKISAVKEEFQSLVRVGETYDQALVSQLLHLPEDIDPMGEKGEFHTRVIFQDPDEMVQ